MNLFPKNKEAWFHIFLHYVLPIGLLIAGGLFLFGSSGRDDAHITYWPAYTLQSFGQVLNYNGERVEQSSSLLQVMLLALAAKVLPLKMVTLGKLSSIFFGAASIGILNLLATKIKNGTAWVPVTLFAALHPYFMYWSFGGLETTIASFTGMLAILFMGDYLKSGRIVKSAAAMSLFILVRPESPLILGCILFGAAGIGVISPAWNQILPRLWKLLGAYLFIFSGVVLFRYLYFGSLFPQPVSAKTDHAIRDVIGNGIGYVMKNLWGSGWDQRILLFVFISGMAFAFITLFKKQNPHILLSLLYITGYIAFAILVGGDWMEGGRFLVPFIPVMVALLPLFIENIPLKRAHLAAAVFFLLLVEVSALITFTRESSTGMAAFDNVQMKRSFASEKYSWFEFHNRVNMRDVYVIDYMDSLVTTIAKDHTPVTIMSAQMGMISYHTSRVHFGNVEFIDRAQLTDRKFLSCIISGNTPIDASYENIFANFDLIEEKCDIPRPDIVFDVGASDLTPKMLSEYGYVLAFTQDGEVRGKNGWLEGYVVKGWQLVGVREDLFKKLDIQARYIRLPKQAE